MLNGNLMINGKIPYSDLHKNFWVFTDVETLKIFILEIIRSTSPIAYLPFENLFTKYKCLKYNFWRPSKFENKLPCAVLYKVIYIPCCMHMYVCSHHNCMITCMFHLQSTLIAKLTVFTYQILALCSYMADIMYS